MNSSFTLIETIFVVVIIAILAVIALPRLEETQNDALISVEKATAGAARQSIISYHGWALIHTGESNVTQKLIDEKGKEYNCSVIFSPNRYPLTLTSKSKSGSTDNNYTVGSGASIGEYRTLAPMMLDPSTIKDWNSTRIDSNVEHLNGPASNYVESENAQIKKGSFWRYDNRSGSLSLFR